jgi:hypothetical protein
MPKSPIIPLRAMPCRIAVLQDQPRGPSQRLSVTSLQLSESERLRIRRRAVNSIYPRLTQAITVLLRGDLSKPSIVRLADAVAAKKGVKIDRRAKRTKEGLLCWLCENAPELMLERKPPASASDPPKPSESPPASNPCGFDWTQLRSDPELIREEEMLLRGFEMGYS